MSTAPSSRSSTTLDWPSIESMRRMVALPPGYRLDLMQPDEIGAVIQSFRAWFPSISVGLGRSFLEERFYADRVVRVGDLDKDVMAILVRHEDGIAGIATWEREANAGVLYGRLGAVSPQHRKSKLAFLAMELGEAIGRQMGAGLVYGMATTRTPYMQQALEHAGYQVVGIMPGYDREEIEPGVVRRVYEVMYAKQLAADDEFLLPEAGNLSPRAAEVFQTLFPG